MLLLSGLRLGPYMVKAVAKIICVYFRPRRADPRRPPDSSIAQWLENFPFWSTSGFGCLKILFNSNITSKTNKICSFLKGNVIKVVWVSDFFYFEKKIHTSSLPYNHSRLDLTFLAIVYQRCVLTGLTSKRRS